MEVDMFENWYIAYLLALHRYEEMQAEGQNTLTPEPAPQKEKTSNRHFGKTMLFMADLLIKAGMRLKRRWSPKRRNPCNGLATSLDDP
jgi:hypothetical protein